MSDESLQLHVDPVAWDTISAGDPVPIIFVPGVMGSRITMPSADRTWDPDSATSMLRWLPPPSRGAVALVSPILALGVNEARWRRANRKALSAHDSKATVLTKLSGNATKDLANDRACIDTWKASVGPLAPLKVEEYHHLFGNVRGWGGVVWKGFYGKILMALEATFNKEGKHPVYAFGYDWRSSNDESGYKLADLVDKVLSDVPSAKDVIIVTHSMGGLVARAALAWNSSLASKIRGVVHGAQPSNGAVVCYRRFFTGCQSSLDGSGETADWFLNRIMGNTPADYAYNLSACVGPLELLPNHVYQKHMGAEDTPWLGGPSWAPGFPDFADIYSLYKGYKWPGIAGSVSQAQSAYGTSSQISSDAVVNEFLSNLDIAKDFHLNVETTAHPNTFVVLSSGVPTDNHLSFASYPTGAKEWVRPTWEGDDPNALRDLTGMKEGVGDGTVPTVSGMCPALKLAAPAVVIPGLLHAAVYSDSKFNDQVVTFIRMLLGVPAGVSLTKNGAKNYSSAEP